MGVKLVYIYEKVFEFGRLSNPDVCRERIGPPA